MKMMFVVRMGLLQLLLLTSCQAQAPTVPNEEGQSLDRIQSLQEQNTNREMLGNHYSLPITELLEKWNALAEASSVSELALVENRLYIDRVQHQFAYPFEDGSLLSGTLHDDDTITKMTIHAVPNKTNTYDVLMLWAMVIAVTNPDILPNEVDAYFNNLNIEPNGDLHAAIGKEIVIHNNSYSLSKTGDQLLFIFERRT